MTTEDKLPPTNVLMRWSKRKHEAARSVPEAPVPAATPALSPQTPPASPESVAAPNPALVPEAVPLPSVDSLSFESDFAVFLRPQVDEALKRQALKKLFSDARFNVMDGLDIYIDDYTKADPISPEVIRQLVQGRGIFGLHDEVRAAGDEQPAAAGAVDGAMAAASAPTAPAELPAPETPSPAEGAGHAIPTDPHTTKDS